MTTIYLQGGAVQVINTNISSETAKEIAGSAYVGMSSGDAGIHPEINPLDDGSIPEEVKLSRRQALKEAKSAYKQQKKVLKMR